MHTVFLSLYMKFRDLKDREDGQDLIEYALLAALIALGSTAAMSNIGTAISNVFNSVSSTLATV
jgi:pilus assembly protein Flp/PilA